MTIVSNDVYSRITNRNSLLKGDVNLSILSASGDAVKQTSEPTFIPMKLGSQEIEHLSFIVRDSGMNSILLGNDFLAKYAATIHWNVRGSSPRVFLNLPQGRYEAEVIRPSTIESNVLYASEDTVVTPGQWAEIPFKLHPQEKSPVYDDLNGVVEVLPVARDRGPVQPVTQILRIGEPDVDTVFVQNHGPQPVTVYEGQIVGRIRRCYAGPSELNISWPFIESIVRLIPGSWLGDQKRQLLLNMLKLFEQGFALAKTAQISDLYNEFSISPDNDSFDYDNPEDDAITLPTLIDVLEPQQYGNLWEEELRKDKNFPERLKEEFIDWIKQNAPQAFVASEDDIGRLTDESGEPLMYTCHLTNYTPLSIKVFAANEIRTRQLELLMGRFLDLGIVVKGRSMWNAPMFLVKRAAGEGRSGFKLRAVVDYRLLNKRIISSFYTMPLLNQTLHDLRNSSYFSSFDVRYGLKNVLNDCLKKGPQNKANLFFGPSQFPLIYQHKTLGKFLLLFINKSTWQIASNSYKVVG